MLFQYTDNPERSSNSEINSSCDSEPDTSSENCVVHFMVVESWVKIEARKDNRIEIYFVKRDNCKDDILCGRMFIVESPVVASITTNKLRFNCFVLAIWLAGFGIVEI